jgi:hypothetical protein
MNEGTPQVPIDHVFRDMQLPGNLVRVHAMEAVQNEDCPSPLRQFGDCLAKDTKTHRHVDGVVRSRGVACNRMGLGLGPGKKALFEAGAAVAVHAEIDGRANEKIPERANANQRLRLFRELQIEVMNDFARRTADVPSPGDRSAHLIVVGRDSPIEKIAGQHG